MVAQQIDGVALHAVRLIAKVAVRVDWRWRGTVPPVSSPLSPYRLRAQMERVSPVTGHSSDA